jgi:branched-chain amino acid transport system substrate-binding protein
VSFTARAFRRIAIAACAAVIALALVVPGCKGHGSNDIVLGALTARTGERAPWGEDLFRGIELAVEQINLRGGVLGRRVRIASVDDGSHDEQVAGMVTRLIDREGAVAVFGEISTAACERAAHIAQRRSVPFIAAGNTSRDLSRIGDFVFRTALTDGEQATALAHYARTTLQKRRAAVVYRRNSGVNLGIADAFTQSFRAAGGEVILRDTIEGEDTELVALAGRVRTANVDVVFIPANAVDAARISLALRHGRVTAQIIGTDSWNSPDLRRYEPEAITGVLVTDAYAPMVARPDIEAFQQAFRERYHAAPGTFAALGFDAVRWTLSAAARVPVLDARGLRDALAGSRLDEGVLGPMEVDARRALTRTTNILRVEPEGFSFVASVPP